MSYVKFVKKECGDEYLVMNKKGQVLAQISKYKYGKMWKFFPVFHPMDDDGKDLWFALDCMEDIVEFMQGLK